MIWLVIAFVSIHAGVGRGEAVWASLWIDYGYDNRSEGILDSTGSGHGLQLTP